MKHFVWKKRTAAFLAVWMSCSLASVLLAAPLRTLPLTVTGYTGTETLTDFPVLVRLSEQIEGFSYADCAPDGADVSFTLEDGTALAREIDTWDPHGESLIWVRIPALTKNLAFECRYDDSAVTAQPASQSDGSVWKPSGYIGVWHMDEVDAKDSTGLGADGTGKGNQTTDGAIGPGQLFDGHSKIDCGAGPAAAFDKGFSVECWVRPDLFGGDRVFVWKGGCFSAKMSSASQLRFTTLGLTHHDIGGADLVQGEWSHLVYTFLPGQADGFHLYKDGALLGQKQSSAIKTPPADSKLFLGATSGDDQNLTGVLDEIRISKVVRSADWARACHETMSSPSFLSPGSILFRGDNALKVEAAPFEVGSPEPSYGLHQEFPSGTAIDCSAPPAVTNEAAGFIARCTGWKLLDADNVLVASGQEPRCTVTQNGGFVRLIWSYELSYRVTAAAEAGGSVDRTVGWYDEGEAVTITATPEGGKSYVRWSGDVPAGQERNLTLTFPVTNPASVTAHFDPVIYVSPTGDDSDGTTWETAFQTIETALDFAVDGETIKVGEGRYPTESTLKIDKGVRIIGAGDRDKIILDGQDARRVLEMACATGLVSGVVIERGYGWGGGGVLISSGVISNCVVRNCTKKTGRGAGVSVNGGLLTHSMITNNLGSNDRGAGVYVGGGAVENCLIAYNVMKGTGTGGGLSSHGGKIRSNTIIHNRCDQGGGVFCSYYGSIYHNNIIQHNTFYSSEAVHNHKDLSVSIRCQYNCVYPTDGLKGLNVEAEPLLAADGLTLLPGSPCIGAGGKHQEVGPWDRIVVPPTDIFGRMRSDPPDIGAAQYVVPTKPTCSLSVPRVVFLPDEAVFTAQASGFSGEALRYDWDFDGDGAVDRSSETPSVSVVLPVGSHEAKVTVSDGTSSASATYGKTTVYPASRTIYVSDGNPGARVPYATWETAAPDIQTALGMAADGMTVIVADGTYAPDATIMVLGAVHLRSQNGYEKTILSGSLKRRTIWIDNVDAIVEGFTIRDGAASCGLGQNVRLNNGTLEGCRVTACAEYPAQGGAICSELNPTRFVRILRCIVDNNKVTGQGPAGIDLRGKNIIVENCLITNNVSLSSGGFTGAGIKSGAQQVTIRNCTIANNHAKLGPAGIAGTPALIENCIVTGNTTLDDGADSNDIAAGTLRNNCVYPSMKDYTGQEGMVVADPLFKNEAKGDLRLRSASPCVNAGYLGEWPEGAVDLAGKPRVKSRRIDMGCFEMDAWTGTMLFVR